LLAANGVTPDTISRNPNLAAAITALGPNARIVGIDPAANGAAGVVTPAGTGLVIPPGATATQPQNSPTSAAAANQQSLSSLPSSSGTEQEPSLDTIARAMGVPVEALVRTATDHVVWVLDEVREPGAYVAAEGTTVAEMIQMAGGVLRQADLSSVEVTSTEINPQSGTSRTIRTAYKGEVNDFQRVSLRPLDVIRLRPVFSDREDGRVTVSGQVRFPGTFDITRGERLSSLLERAGGLPK
jgi:protein involved in polysaccharide export with SLBB domain